MDKKLYRLDKFKPILDELGNNSNEYMKLINIINEDYFYIKYIPTKYSKLTDDILYTARIEYRKENKRNAITENIFLHKNTVSWMVNSGLNLKEWTNKNFYYSRL